MQIRPAPGFFRMSRGRLAVRVPIINSFLSSSLAKICTIVIVIESIQRAVDSIGHALSLPVLRGIFGEFRVFWLALVRGLFLFLFCF